MKVRLLLVFTVLFVFSYGLSAYRRPSIYSQQIITRPTPTATPTPSQSDQAKMSVTKWIEDLEVAEKNVTRIFIIFVKVLAVLLSILIVYRLILMIFQRSSQLIVDNFINASDAGEMNSVKRRIRIGKAIAGLMTGDVNLILEAIAEIEKLTKGWDETSELNTRFLYNLAAWYAIAYRINAGVKTALSLARRYLVYALVRNSDRTIWEWAGKDPDLQGICEDYEELKFILLKKLNEIPALPSLTGKNFTQHTEEILSIMGNKQLIK